MISIVRVSGQVYTKESNPWIRSRQEVYCDAADLGDNMANAPRDVANATPLYIMDWDTLSDETKAQLRSRIHIWSEGRQAWLPQGI